jgi:hypothetical protein
MIKLVIFQGYRFNAILTKFPILLFTEMETCQAPVAHACNPSYLSGES